MHLSFNSRYYQDELIVDGANSIEMPNSDNDKLVDVTLLFEGVPNATNDQGKAITCVVNDALGRKIERQVILDVSGTYPSMDYYENDVSMKQ